MESHAFAFRLTSDDWRAWQKECAARVRQTLLQPWTIFFVVALALAGFGTAALFDAVGVPLQASSALAGAVLASLAILLYLRFWAKASAPASGSLFFDECRYVLGPEGIHVTRSNLEGFTRWAAVRSITGTAEHLFLWIDRTQAHVIPVRALPGGVLPADLLATMERWRGEKVAEAGPTYQPAGELANGTGPAPPEPDGRRWISGLPRLLALRHASGMKDVPTWLVWLLAGLTLIGWIALDRLRTGPGAIFGPYGPSGIAWYVLILLAIAATLSSLSRPRVSLRSTLASLLALVLVLFVLAAAAILLSVPKTALLVGSLVAGIYCIVVAARLLSSTSGRNQPLAVLSGAVVVAGAWLLTACLYVDASVWYAPDPEEYADYSKYWDRGASLLFEQPARIDAAIADLAPPNDDSPAAFFLGFAGYGEERVFAEEIKLAARVVGERYGSSDRSLLLLNDRRDLESEPLATVVSLRYALRKLAAKMDADEDILFLALSSHGSEDYLAVSNGPLMVLDLTDEALADALQDSGIKWRVIVISACYSGSFIDELRDPNSVVITAAAADRTSFGCSDSRDLTYFGEAFYRDAFPEASSLRDAYESAVQAIAEREQREDIEPSRPQAHFGEAIERKLASFESDR